LLVTVDWFIDRCRTAINVMGDMTVSALIDGKKQRIDPELSVIEQADDLEANVSQ
jgi:Na+/H+-dicarboxylate symporter